MNGIPDMDEYENNEEDEEENGSDDENLSKADNK
jgi:hypothetical protein